MRVLLVHQPVDGGVGRHVADLATGLPALGYEVITCGPAPSTAMLGDGEHGEHVYLDLGRAVSPADLRMTAQFARILKRVRPQLVHAHSSKAGAIARLAKLTHGRVPVLYTPHGFAFAGHFRLRAERRAYREAERMLGRLTDRVVCVCEAEARLARLLIPSERVRVVHNGVPNPGEGPPDPAMQQLARLGPVICTLGLMRAGKGVETLIDAMPAVVARHPRAQLAVWGEGPETETLRRRAKLRRVADAIHFLGPTSDPLLALRGSTVFVMPSWRESFPYVVLEAMSVGVPIVSSDVGGVREAIADGEHGLLVAPADSHALARGIALLLDDADRRARLGAAARTRVAREFTQHGMLTSLSKVYTEISAFGRF
ncbi:MAG: glycosyltransferase family 4 protein [Solirubrobacteraceae bacterium]